MDALGILLIILLFVTPTLIATYWYLRIAPVTGVLSVLGRSFLVSSLVMIITFMIASIYFDYQTAKMAIETCGSGNCISKLDGPGPAGFLMMQGMAIVVIALGAFAFNFTMGCVIALLRYVQNINQKTAYTLNK